jgi:hypothetical protein
LATRSKIADEPSPEVLAALLGARPFFPRVLEDKDGVRPFESMADLKRVADHLGELAARADFAEALGADLAAMSDAPEPRSTIDDYARTAVVRYLASGSFDATPVSQAELQQFLRHSMNDGELTEPARRLAAQGLASWLDIAGVRHHREIYPTMLSHWLDYLSENLGGLDPDAPLDPRVLGGILTSIGKH